MIQNSSLWTRRFREEFVPATHLVKATFLGRLLPTFATVDREAGVYGEALWKETMSRPDTSDWIDEADIAEAVQDAEVTFYQSLKGMEQGLLNCCAVFLYHLFEQHLLILHRQELLGWREQNDTSLYTHKEIYRRLGALGVNIKSFSCWPKLEELRHLANAIKHGEGRSSDFLNSSSPELFRPPGMQESPFLGFARRARVFAPLFGEDIYVTPEKIQEYAEAIESFWLALGSPESPGDTSDLDKRR